MLLRTSHWLYPCKHRSHAPAALVQACPHRVTYHANFTHLFCLPVMRLQLSDRSAVLKTIAQTTHFHVRLCWVKIDSAVRFGEMSSWSLCNVCCESGSESLSDMTGEDLVLVQWVILPCFLPHRDIAVSCLTNDMLTASSSTTDCYDDWCQISLTLRHPTDDSNRPCRCGRPLRSFSTMRLLLCTCCLSLAPSFE